MNDAEIENKHYYLIAPLIGPIIAKRRRIATQKLEHAFRTKERNFDLLAAELTALADLENDINSRANAYETQLEGEK